MSSHLSGNDLFVKSNSRLLNNQMVIVIKLIIYLMFQIISNSVAVDSTDKGYQNNYNFFLMHRQKFNLFIFLTSGEAFSMFDANYRLFTVI